MNLKLISSGGLGNQMFQYAFAKALSLFHQCELYIRFSHRKFCRKYLLKELFHIEESKEDILEWNNIIQETETYSKGLEKKYFENLTSNSKNNYVITGYWQNENYFNRYEKEIRQTFHIEPIPVDKDKLLIQVRRGDYVNNPRFEYCDANWYFKAISEFQINNLLIISDDPDWCKRTFRKYNIQIIYGDELKHLRYMVGAKNLIISNSSFAWWGAYLSNSNNVIYPEIWLPRKPEQKTGCSKWIKLKK